MCGIVGFIGHKKDAKEVVLSGLTKLEYRGYDSAGISLFNSKFRTFDIYKDFGRVQKLIDLTKNTLKSNIGIGHTRWATHGKVTKDNAHPHYSQSKRFIIVHNGVIENNEELKSQYLPDSFFYSETDTEVIAQLIETFAKQLNVENAILTTLKLLEGSYALLVIDTQSPETIYAAKNKSPLVLGKGDDGITIASDLMALIGYADKYIALADHTFVVAEADQVKLYDLNHDLQPISYLEIDLDETSTDMGEYQHYMLKEIYEQPSVVRRIVQNYFNHDEINISDEVLNDIKKSDRIYILAAGTSMHAGYIGKYLFEELTHIPTEVHIASEFAYHTPLLTEKPFFLMISQSGETADLRACLLKTQKLNYKTLTITNVKTSTLARESNYYLELFAGPEIAVASTKAYVAQVAVLSVLCNAISNQKLNLVKELTQVALSIEDFLSTQDVSSLVHAKITKRNCFYIGRTLDYYTSLEAALKLKEISYIQTEGFAAGELKHGTIALIEEGTPVIALISNQEISKNTRSNLNEVISRGATTMIISLSNTSQENDDIILKDVHPLLTPMVMVVPTQLIAYYAALERGHDIDKPRNLAKSVTVE
ncbi:MAG: glutamine--fructose-6-phosphate transaminase (isomerizing) [Acholeplasmataceae bacterium]|nr:glutamine--fructose-6-phosphate transaminase (isomerizing) [Acholeplasmataceae bacterium]